MHLWKFGLVFWFERRCALKFIHNIHADFNFRRSLASSVKLSMPSDRYDEQVMTEESDAYIEMPSVSTTLPSPVKLKCIIPRSSEAIFLRKRKISWQKLSLWIKWFTKWKCCRSMKKRSRSLRCLEKRYPIWEKRWPTWTAFRKKKAQYISSDMYDEKNSKNLNV